MGKRDFLGKASYAFTINPPGTALGFADVASAKLGSAATLFKAPAATMQRAGSALSGRIVGDKAPATPSPNSQSPVQNPSAQSSSPPAQSQPAQSVPPVAAAEKPPAALDLEAERPRRGRCWLRTPARRRRGERVGSGRHWRCIRRILSWVSAWTGHAIAPHIIYALYGAAYGFLGLLIVPVLALVIALRGARKVALPVALALLLGGLFSHNVMTDYSILLPLGLAASR